MMNSMGGGGGRHAYAMHRWCCSVRFIPPYTQLIQHLLRQTKDKEDTGADGEVGGQRATEANCTTKGWEDVVNPSIC